MPISLEDRVGIDDLLMEYVWTCDTADIDGYVRTFIADGVLVDSTGETHAGRAAIRAYADRFFALPDSRGRAHFFQKMKLKAEGEAIRVFSFWQVVQAKAETRSARVRSVGTCDDLCVRTPGGWRFARRVIGRWNDQTATWKFP